MSARDPRSTTPRPTGRSGVARPRPRRPAEEGPADRWPVDEPTARTGPPGWREDPTTAAGLNLLAGVWLVISPWVLNYNDADSWWNPIVFGAIVAALALARVAMPARTAALSAINAAIGVWLFISGFWLADSGQAAWNDWIMGAIVFILAFIAVGARREAPLA
jgi:hypothetical protein